MSNKKASEEQTPADPMPDSTYNDWARQMVENLVEAERKLLDMATQQNEMVFKAIREGLEFYRSAPTPTLAEWARQGLENLLEAQRKWTESATQQRFNFFQTQASGEAAQTATSTVADYAQQQIEMLAETRKRWLDFAAKQNAQVVNGVKKALRLEENPAASTYADWAQQAVDNYVEIQKRWLDLAVQFPFQWSNRKSS
jgi:hypothetical protein